MGQSAQAATLLENLLALPDRPAAVVDAGIPALVQASAIGVYGPRRPGELLREDSARGDGFLADVVTAWESAAAPVKRTTVWQSMDRLF